MTNKNVRIETPKGFVTILMCLWQDLVEGGYSS